MSDREGHELTRDDAAAPRPGWRFWLGILFFALAWLVPLGIPLVALTGLSMAAKATISGLLLAGLPEVFGVVAIVLLGRDGFAWVEGRALAILRRYGPPREVGRTRYYIGLTMLFLPGIYAWIGMYVPDRLPGYSEHRISIALTLDSLFFASFLVLGGDFWDKVRALFVHGAKARFPERVE